MGNAERIARQCAFHPQIVMLRRFCESPIEELFAERQKKNGKMEGDKMALSKSQRTILALYRSWHQGGAPRVMKMLDWRLPLFALGVVAFIWEMYFVGPVPQLAQGAWHGLLGLLTGIGLDLARYVFCSTTMWPTIDQITDWQKVEQLLAD